MAARRLSSKDPLSFRGEDTKPYERSELGDVGEELCVIGRAAPSPLRLGSKLPSLAPLP
jgi:hypothetical protein